MRVRGYAVADGFSYLTEPDMQRGARHGSRYCLRKRVPDGRKCAHNEFD